MTIQQGRGGARSFGAPVADLEGARALVLLLATGRRDLLARLPRLALTRLTGLSGVAGHNLLAWLLRTLRATGDGPGTRAAR